MLCTSLAVFVGKLLAKKISERVVNLVGGILFLVFALFSLLAFIDCCPQEEESIIKTF